MEYPHWVMVIGACLVAVGFIGLAFYKNTNAEKNAEKENKDTEEEIPPSAKHRPF